MAPSGRDRDLTPVTDTKAQALAVASQLGVDAETHPDRAAACERQLTIEPRGTGRSSQAWKVTDADTQWIVRVPIPESDRQTSYRSEERVGDLLFAAGHRVSTWRLVEVDGIECSVGTFLDGEPIEQDWPWPSLFVDPLARLLRDLHRLPATGWGRLENRADCLRGTSTSALEGIVARWRHATIWPFDGSELDAHPIAEIAPDLVSTVAPLRAEILEAASEPFGVVHSDLHRDHLLARGDEFAGLLDFGDSFVGSTAWDFALLRWYYGALNTERVIAAYGSERAPSLMERATLLAVAVGCYKVAKEPTRSALIPQLVAILATT